MKAENEILRDSEQLSYEIPTTSVCMITHHLSILNGSDGYPTEMEDGGNDC